MLHKIKRSLLLAGMASFVALPAYAQMGEAEIMAFEDESPIVISGKVVNLSDDEFHLSYGPDQFIIVEMDDWDWFEDETKMLSIGDDVVVSGHIDDDLFEGREIEADTVYLVSDSAFYYRDQATATPLYMLSLNQPTEMDQATAELMAEQMAGQEPAAGDMTIGKMKGEKSQISAVGMVTEIHDQAFKISSGEYDLTIDSAEVAEKINDIAIGDRVFVTGVLEQGFFDNREIMADRVVELSQNEPTSDLNMMEDMSYGIEDMSDQTIAQ